ncbi:MAG: hypothetical protein Q8P05_01690 [Candidatus Diapherotrites archaeon]|nr:hypothetical protein [Candidatus Diapherotrites archaeon]MDZ4256368.1 hypothetical protein [archaeon]
MSPQVERFNNRLKRNSKVVILRRHLNPSFRIENGEINEIRAARVSGPILISPFYAGGDPKNYPAKLAISIAFVLSANPFIAQIIQRFYSELPLDQPIIMPPFERFYPEGWIQASRIKETHPIYYVDMKGNLVFVKNSRMEYFRYLFQKSLLGRLGYNPWWWRGYIEPPKAPEPVKKWAKEQLRKLMEKIPRKPVLKPSLVPVHFRRSDPKFQDNSSSRRPKRMRRGSRGR